MFFPKTIASGESFCNREEERKRLNHNIKNTQPTLVISPRRYGKTSLILKAIEEMHWPYAHADLFLAFDESKIVERFLSAITQLVSQLMPINLKAITKIKEFFKPFTVSMTVGQVSFGLKLESTQPNQIITVKNALESLENLLKKNKKQAVFFIDEMQDIVQTPVSGEIEALLRFYAQKTKNIAFIFSGSNRKLLKKIFEDKSRPLFKMCDRLNLQRINQTDYQKFLTAAATKNWKQTLTQESFNAIFTFTELHSYYMNYLCSRLWQFTNPPTVEEVNETWREICEEETSNIAIDIASLSINQKKLLSYIADKGWLTNPTSQEHQQKVQLTSRGILQSLKGLLERDILETTKNGIRITDPALKTILSA